MAEHKCFTLVEVTQEIFAMPQVHGIVRYGTCVYSL